MGTVKTDNHLLSVKYLPVPPAFGKGGKGYGLCLVHAGDDNMHMQLQSRFPVTGFCPAGFHLGIIAFIMAFCFHTSIPYQIITGLDFLPVKVPGIFVHASAGEFFQLGQYLFLLTGGQFREFPDFLSGHLFYEMLLLLTTRIDGKHIELIIISFQGSVVIVYMMHDSSGCDKVFFVVKKNYHSKDVHPVTPC